jgi:hypothetical protein
MAREESRDMCSTGWLRNRTSQGVPRWDMASALDPPDERDSDPG